MIVFTKSRYFRFSLRRLLAFVTAAAAMAMAIRQLHESPGVQGAWRGTAGHERFTLEFSGDSLIVRAGNNPIVAPRASRFQLDAAKGYIDIHRDDGMQLGLYSVDGDTLTLTLADVNQPRPKVLKPKKSSHHERRYVFQRRR
jgi:hypothetical protein